MRRTLSPLGLALALTASSAHAGIGELDPSSNADLGLLAGGAVGAVAGGVLLYSSFALLRDLQLKGWSGPERFVPVLALGAGSLLLASGFLADQSRHADARHPWGVVGATGWVVASAGFVALASYTIHAWIHAPQWVPTPEVVPDHAGHPAAALALSGRF